MITLNLKREPYWIDVIDGLRLFVRPATTALIMAARVAAFREETGDPAERSTALLKNLAELAVLEWEGVGDEAGNILPVTKEAVAALLDLWPVAEAFERLYLTPALLLEQEKNA
jgi:hypothetical protein